MKEKETPKKVKHIPTGKVYIVIYKKENKYGLWYYTENNLWLFANDCKNIYDF